MVSRWAMGIAGIGFMVIYFYFRVSVIKKSFLTVAINWIGEISFELYLSHMALVYVFNHYELWTLLPGVLTFSLFSAISILLAKTVSVISKRVLVI